MFLQILQVTYPSLKLINLILVPFNNEENRDSAHIFTFRGKRK